MSAVRVPKTLEEFYAELGKWVMIVTARESGVVLSQADLNKLSKAALIEAGQLWCSLARPQLQGLVVVAERRLRDSLTNFLSDLVNDLEGVRTFLARMEPRYLADVVQEGMKKEGRELEEFIALLRQIAETHK